MRRGFWIVAGVAVVVLAWLGRGLTFWSDEWTFIADRRLFDPGTWWAPHNEHWSTVAIIVYRALVETVGLRTYVPYLLVVALLHVGVAWMVFRAVERRAGPGAALGAGTLVLFFGAGFENLLWGFQIGFVGSTLAGLVALDALDGPPSVRRASLVAGSLLVGVMTSGVGLCFLVAAAAAMALTRPWQRWLALLIVPAGAYLAWFLAIGHVGIGLFREPLAASSLAAIPGFVAGGFVAGIGAATGLDAVGQLVAVIAVLAGAAKLIRDRRPDPEVVAPLAAIIVLYSLIAVTRAGVTSDQVDYSRYTYISGILMVRVFAAPVSSLLTALRARGVGSSRVLVRSAALAVGPIALIVPLVWNVQLLIHGRALFLDRTAITRALVAESMRPDSPAGADLTRNLILVPAPIVIRRLVAEYGSPLTDEILGWAVDPIPPQDSVEARRRLVEGPPSTSPETLP